MNKLSELREGKAAPMNVFHIGDSLFFKAFLNSVAKSRAQTADNQKHG